MKKNIYSSSMWDGRKLKISILVPTRDMVHSQFAFSLTQLVKTTEKSNIETYVFFDSSTILLNQRERLVKMAMEVESDYILWLDSDMTFPSTTLLRLLSHEKDIVGCNYLKRSKPVKPVAYTNVGDWDSWVPMETKDELVKVEGVGMGCILMKTDLFKQLDEAEALFSKGSIKNAQKKVRDVMSKTKGIGKIPNKLRHKLNFAIGQSRYFVRKAIDQ